MRIELHSSVISDLGEAHVGDVIDVPEKEALIRIERGEAHAVSDDDVRPAKYVDGVQSATIPPVENAMKPGPQARRSQHASA